MLNVATTICFVEFLLLLYAQPHTTPGDLPDVQQHQLSRALHVRLIRQLSEEVGERWGKAAAAAAGGRAEEEQEDSVLQAADQFQLRVQFVPLPVVLHQDAVHKQVHHGGQVGGWEGGDRKWVLGSCR